MINLGNKRLKTIRKGSERIVRIFKGDEKIFEDFEAIYSWKFTIDTTLTTTGTHNNSVKTFTLKRNANYLGNHGDVPIKIDWGDGTEEQATISTTGSKAHTYTNPGVYQITILPVITQWGLLSGWLTGLLAPASANSDYTLVNAESAKVVSIDKSFPANSYIIAGYNVAETAYSRAGCANMFNSLCNIQSYPSGLLDGLVFVSSPGTLRYAFSNFGKMTGCNPYPLAKKLIDSMGFSSRTSMAEMFKGTFANTAAAIPEDIFESVDTSNTTNFEKMFLETFSSIGSLDTLPERLFSSINTEKGTSFSSMFQGTFQFSGTTSTTITLPGGLFSFLDTRRGTNFKNMFSSTFTRFGYNSSSITIPENLFSSLNTSIGTTFGGGNTGDGMFSSTFSEFGYNSTVLDIPENLFSSLSLASATDIRGLFLQTFGNCGYRSTAATIPEKLFYFMDTSNIVNFYNVFASTFYQYGGGGAQKTIPANIFSTINTTNGVNFSSMFSGTFSGIKAVDIPATLFSTITTQNATNMSGMFNSTFSYSGTEASRITVPSTLFSTITGTNCTNFSSMFGGLFSGCYLVEFPSTIFSPITTTNGTNFNNMFQNTFNSVKVLQGTIPSTIFATIDTTNGTSFRQMFTRTFAGATFAQPSSTTIALSGLFDGIKTPNGSDFYEMFASTFSDVFRYVQGSISADLFQYIDLSGATNLESMFSGTFANTTKLSNIPAGLFGRLKIPSGLSSYNSMFSSTFNNGNNLGEVTHTIGDVFSGMTDFSWATADNAVRLFPYMFGSHSAGDRSSGDINDILQHFNFIPATRTYMFVNRTGMTNYNTINVNWK